MSPSDPSPQPHPSAAGRFATTHWSLVAAARDRDTPEAEAALAALCGSYWYPLYAFVRRQGFDADQAQDLTQEFFARLLEKDFLQAVDPRKGKFRSFLLAACKHFLANERDRAAALKRGGGQSFVSLDFHIANDRFTQEPADPWTPERFFERQWALAVLDRVLARLRQEFDRAGKGDFFDRLKFALIGQRSQVPYSELARQLDMTEGAIKVAVHRLRQRYRELLREEVGQTVEEPGRIDDEIRELFAALGR